MDNEYKSIYEFDYKLICDLFSLLERQGPGCPEITLKALSFIDNLGEDSRIADLGCGTGGQTMVLARNTSGTITGVDLSGLFIDIFNRNAAKMNLQGRVKGIVASMDDLPFGDEEFDLIWSEGAIYNIGFKRGLEEWRRYLKRGGYIAVSEATWFTEERPEEINSFWMGAYDGIDTIPRKVAQMQEAGYVPVATFILPEYCWTEYYLEPQAKVMDTFLAKHSGDKAAADLIANERHEAQMYERYKQYYGYAFYIGRKI
jgi:ubiquinone/menaquinone biosynthesis C-methylase UbiE